MNSHTHKHTCYGVDVFSTHALDAVACGVFYSLSLGKDLNIFIALALYVKVHVIPTCIAQRTFSERSPRDRVEKRRVTGGGSLRGFLSMVMRS
jgi:hypothetical protein